MSTYTFQQAVDHCVTLVKGIPVSTISTIAVDQVNSIFWRAYPWRWARSVLTPISLVDGTQDYTISSPNFWKLLLARIALTSSTPVQYRDLRIFRHQEPLLVQKIGWPNFQLISYETDTQKLRLEAAASVPSGYTMQIQGEYQQIAAKVTSLATTVPFPDQNLNVFVDGLLWMLYRVAGDKRAGSAIVTPRGVQYTGQMGIFYDGMVMMKEEEESGQGDSIYPEDSIGAAFGGVPNFFGF